MAISKISGVPIDNIAKFNGVPIDDIDTINGVALGGAPPVTADKVAVLPGGSSDYFSAPDTPSTAFPDDMDVIVHAQPVDWAPANAEALVSQQGGSGEYSWEFYLGTNGYLNFFGSNTGSDFKFANSGVVTGFSPNQSVWVRYTYQQSGDVFQFYTSLDGVTWTPLGGPQNPGLGNVAPSTQPIVVGALATGGDLLTGNIYRALAYDTIDGATPIFDFNPDQAPSYGLLQSWTDDVGNVWTGQGQARISAVNTLVEDTFTDDDGTLLDGRMPDQANIPGGVWEDAASGGTAATINGNQLELEGANHAVYIETGVTDVRVEKEIIGPRTLAYSGVAVGHDGVGSTWADFDFVVLLRDNNSLNMYTNGTPRGVNANATKNTGVVGITVEGAVMTATLDDGTSSSYTHSAPTTNTKHGSTINGGVVMEPEDNFKVTNITDNPL